MCIILILWYRVCQHRCCSCVISALALASGDYVSCQSNLLGYRRSAIFDHEDDRSAVCQDFQIEWILDIAYYQVIRLPYMYMIIDARSFCADFMVARCQSFHLLRHPIHLPERSLDDPLRLTLRQHERHARLEGGCQESSRLDSVGCIFRALLSVRTTAP